LYTKYGITVVCTYIQYSIALPTTCMYLVVSQMTQHQFRHILLTCKIVSQIFPG